MFAMRLGFFERSATDLNHEVTKNTKTYEQDLVQRFLRGLRVFVV